MIILLDTGYHLLLKKEEENITFSGHSEPGLLMRENDTGVLPETDAKFWQILQ